MNDDMMFEYLLQMGATRPERDELERKQAMVDALRMQSMTAPKGQMIDKHYVAPSITQYAAQLGNAVMARQGQEGVNKQSVGLNNYQRGVLEMLRKKRQEQSPVETWMYGAGTGGD